MEDEQVVSVDSGAPSLDGDVQSFISGIEKEYEAANLEEQLAAAEPTTEAPKEPDKVEATPVDPPAKTPVDAGLERLVAREVEIRGREEAFSRKEAEYKALEARLQAAEARQVPQDVVGGLRNRPTETLKAMGLDPDDLVRRAIAEKMGDKAPEQLRQKLEQSSTQAQIQALEQKIISQERERAQQEFFNKVNSSAREYVGSGLGTYAPTVAEVAKKAPDRVHQEIMQEIIQDAQIRGPREPNGELLSFEDAAKRVEARWDAFKKLLSPSDTTALASTADSSKTSALGNTTAKVITKTQTSPATKPPDRPLAPWQIRSDIEEEGIRAALMEYKRVESGKNQ